MIRVVSYAVVLVEQVVGGVAGIGLVSVAALPRCWLGDAQYARRAAPRSAEPEYLHYTAPLAYS